MLLAPLRLLLVLLALAALTAGAEESPREQIDRWILELDHPEYPRREQAMRALIAAGRPAVAPTTIAIDAGGPELTWRSLEILAELAHSSDPPTQAEAAAALADLSNSPRDNVAARARHWTAELQQAAAARLRKLGAQVNADGVTIGPSWRGGNTGLAALAAVGPIPKLVFNGSPISDEGMPHLASVRIHELHLAGARIGQPGLDCLPQVRGLKFLSLRTLPIRGELLRPIGELTAIEHLGLDETEVGDDDLPLLARLTQLRTLWLNETNVTDAGLLHLASLPRLHKLILTATPVTGPGLAGLGEIESLRYLSLQNVKLDSGQLESLAALTQLESLGLDDTGVTDAALPHLAGLANLKQLWLSHCNLSDAGLPHLYGLKGLQSLHLEGPPLTAEALAKLQAELPKTKILR